MCNLHWCYTFCTAVLHFLHWCYTWTALLSANQNRVIFSCILLIEKSHNSYFTDIDSNRSLNRCLQGHNSHPQVTVLCTLYCKLYTFLLPNNLCSWFFDLKSIICHQNYAIKNLSHCAHLRKKSIFFAVALSKLLFYFYPSLYLLQFASTSLLHVFS